MKTYAPTIKKPLTYKRNYNVLPYQYRQNFRSSSVINNSNFFPSKLFISSTTQSFPGKNFQINQCNEEEEKNNDDINNTNQNDVLLNTNPNYDDIIFDPNRTKPSLFNDSYPKTSTSNSMKLKFEKFGTETTIIGLPRMITDQDQAIRIKAMEQKKELLEILETNNLSAADILLQISTYSTPYSKLLLQVYDELQYAPPNSHSAQVDELERKAAVNSAKKEIEIQQLTDKSIRLKNECTELKKSLKKSQDRLKTINEDIVSLNKLAEIHGVEIENEALKNYISIYSARSEVNNDETSDDEIYERDKDFSDEEIDKPIPLDDEMYKKLWCDHTKLLDEIEELQKQLAKTQEKQAVALHESAVKMLQNRRNCTFMNDS